jgi:hypothetical protein
MGPDLRRGGTKNGDEEMLNAGSAGELG